MVDLKNIHSNSGTSGSVLQRRCSVKTYQERSKIIKSMHINYERISERGFMKIYKPKLKTRYVVIIGTIILLCIALAVAHLMGAFSKKIGKILTPPNPTKPLPSSVSRLHIFSKAAVCADGAPCAEIGKSILEKNGSAVDAAIASMFCNGLVNMQSMGLGGGFLMTVYIREERKAYALNAREFAPLAATPDLFKKNPNISKKTPLAAGVPGELKGYWMAHRKFGKLPWKDLVQPSIDLCERGYNITVVQHDSIKTDKQYIDKDVNLKEWFTGPDGKHKCVGCIVKPTKLCETLKTIAAKGGDELYTGELGKKFVEDVKEMGGIITSQDMSNYTAQWAEPITTQFKNGDHLYSMPLPGGGLLLAFILNILDGYNFTKESIDGVENTVLTYHRIIEAFKYAYASRTQLGDTDFINIENLISNLTSREYAERIRLKINDTTTLNDPKSYGGVYFAKSDHGTAHLSVLAENGDAVSVTSTINLYFGAGHTSKQTGIVLNSGIDDFSFPDFVNFFGLPGSPNNALAPRKRPLSSMSPTIITDKDGDVKLIIGASGGTKIITSVATVIMRILWFGQNIKESVDAPRFHHQLFPMEVSYEYGNLQQVIDGLETLGHNTSRYTARGSIVCAMFRQNGKIFANADFRKGGDVFGY